MKKKKKHTKPRLTNDKLKITMNINLCTLKIVLQICIRENFKGMILWCVKYKTIQDFYDFKISKHEVVL